MDLVKNQGLIRSVLRPLPAMSGDIVVPALGESVTEATVSKWFKAEGDAIKKMSQS